MVRIWSCNRAQPLLRIASYHSKHQRTEAHYTLRDRRSQVRSVQATDKSLHTEAMFRLSLALVVCIAALCISSGLSLKMGQASSPFSAKSLPSLLTAQSIRTSLMTAMVAVSLLPSPSMAVGLGEHTTCAYPACTTQEEILKANAPGLVSTAERDGYVQDLKDMDFILSNAFGAMLEQKDYESMRSGLRQAPMMNLRLTVRKYKDFLGVPEKKLFMSMTPSPYIRTS